MLNWIFCLKLYWPDFSHQISHDRQLRIQEKRWNNSMTWCYAKHISAAARIRSQTCPSQPNQILSFFSSQMEAKLSFQKKKGKHCCHTQKLMVTLSPDCPCWSLQGNYQLSSWAPSCSSRWKKETTIGKHKTKSKQNSSDILKLTNAQFLLIKISLFSLQQKEPSKHSDLRKS